MRNIITLLVCLALIGVIACEEPDLPISGENDSVFTDAEPPETTATPAPTETATPEVPANTPTETKEPQIQQLPPITIPAEETPKQEPAQTTPPPEEKPKTEAPKPTTPVNNSGLPISPGPAQEQSSSTTMGEELQSVIDLADKKVKSYEFTLAPPPDNLARDQYYIRGNKYRVSLYTPRAYKTDDFIDTVYVDTQKKTAIGYCEANLGGRCRNSSEEHPLKYSEWLIKTPYQWLKEIPYGDIHPGQTIYDRPTREVNYEKNGIKMTLFLDEYSGLPLRVIEDRAGNKTTHEYRYLSVNTVTDDYVTHIE